MQRNRSARDRATFDPTWCSGGSLLLALVLLCPTARGEVPAGAAPIVEPQLRRNIQAIALPSSTVDGQTSWIIEPDVPRIPNIPGLDRRLPPHVERRLSYAFDLAQRGATYSANAEFREVLNLCALEMDAREGGTKRREAMQQAWLAIAEADEFNAGRHEVWSADEIRDAAAGHRTAVLNRGAVHASDSIQAVQSYYAFAEERFAYACRGLPGASLAYYGLARTLVVPGTQVSQAAGKAALLQRVALTIAPQNALARNELGVLLAEYGQLDEAEAQFRHCLATSPTPETWRNLAVVYARKGNRTASQAALATADELEARDARSSQLAKAPLVEKTNDESNEGEQQKPKFWNKLNISKLRDSIWK